MKRPFHARGFGNGMQHRIQKVKGERAKAMKGSGVGDQGSGYGSGGAGGEWLPVDSQFAARAVFTLSRKGG